MTLKTSNLTYLALQNASYQPCVTFVYVQGVRFNRIYVTSLWIATQNLPKCSMRKNSPPIAQNVKIHGRADATIHGLREFCEFVILV